MPPGDSFRKRRLLIACAIYLACTVVYFLFADRAVIHAHTPWNHFTLQADAWRHGRLDLGGPPPSYTGNNDFSQYDGKWFVVFPPFPALLLFPLVAWLKDPTRVLDGQFFLWLAGLAPAVLFLGLEKLRRYERSPEASPETGMLRNHLDWMVDLPWGLPDSKPIDIAEARQILRLSTPAA